MNDGPLIVQSDKTLLLEVDHERAAECRKAIAPFAELERSPEHVHTYRLTPLGLWNARAAGHDAEQVVDTLLELQPVRRPARAARRRRRDDGALRPAAAGEAPDPRPGAGRPPTARCSRRCCAPRRSPGMLGDAASTTTPWSCTPPSAATSSRRCSSSAGRPRTSPATSTARRTRSRSTRTGWTLRDYQREAAESFWHGGSGVVVLPCGAGKTHRRRGRDGPGPGDHADPGHQHRRARQWKDELLRRTSLTADEIGEYSGVGQGGPAGHHRDVPGDDHPPEGRLHATSSCSTPATGA